MTTCLTPAATASRTAASMTAVLRATMSAATRANASEAVSRPLRSCERIFVNRRDHLAFKNSRAVGSQKPGTCVAPASARARRYVTIMAVRLARPVFMLRVHSWSLMARALHVLDVGTWIRDGGWTRATLTAEFQHPVA